MSSKSFCAKNRVVLRMSLRIIARSAFSQPKKALGTMQGPAYLADKRFRRYECKTFHFSIAGTAIWSERTRKDELGFI